MRRERFKSLWNGLAMIFFFGGIFLGFDILGYGGVGVGIFMWIIGGTVEDMIFGPKKKKETTPQVTPTQMLKCSSCQEINQPDAEYCIECGAAFSKDTTIEPAKKQV